MSCKGLQVAYLKPFGTYLWLRVLPKEMFGFHGDSRRLHGGPGVDFFFLVSMATASSFPMLESWARWEPGDSTARVLLTCSHVKDLAGRMGQR